MIAPSPIPSLQALEAVVAALRAYETRLHELAVRTSQALPGMLDVAAPSAVIGRHWAREVLLPQRPAASDFLRAGERLSVAEPPLLRRALALRTLYARRSAIRRCIDRPRLDRMREAVGAETLDRLRVTAAEDGDTSLPLPEPLDHDGAQAALAQEGLWRMRQENSITASALIRLIVMQIGARPNSSVKNDYPLDPTVESADEAARFLARLPSLMTELAQSPPRAQ